MKHWRLAGSTALALIMGGTAALAQVTPEEVWDTWQKFSAAQGQSVTTTSVARNGDTLVVEGMAVRADSDGVVVEARLDRVEFRDQGDGTVGVTMSPELPLTMTVPSSDLDSSEPVTIGLVFSQPGLKTVVSGTAAAPVYDFEAPTLGMRLTSVEGVEADKLDATADVTLTAVKGRYALGLGATADAPMAIDSEISAQALSMVLAMKDAETNSDLRFTASVADLMGRSSGNILDTEAMDDLPAALAAGFGFAGGLSYGATTFDMDVAEAGSTTKAKGAAASGDFAVALDTTGLDYAASGQGVTMSISGSDIPFPEVTFSYADAGFNLAMPVTKSDSPQDYAFLLKLVDFVISPEIWGMVDPTGQLPQDPATVILDTKGTVRLTQDLLNEETMAQMEGAPPGELLSLDLTQLLARVAGAELTGSGALAFDNTDLATFGGVPAPTGTVDLKLVGGNALLDKLVAMGLIPQEEAMGVRMMLAMFANTDAATDTMTSAIEFKDKGLFVNGQQMQ